jgi:hypothetical protein
VKGDEGPQFGEGGDAVSDPTGSRAGGGSSHGRLGVLQSEVLKLSSISGEGGAAGGDLIKNVFPKKV